MTSRTIVSAMVAASLLAGVTLTASGQPAELAPGTPPPVEVSVDCMASPERVTVTNNTKRPIKLKSVGSTYQRRAGEPYKVKKTLKPGKSVSYTFGTGNGKGKRLTGSFVFDNDSPKEGVVVKTSKGNVKVRCSEITNVPPEPEPVELVEVSVEPVGVGEATDALELLATLSVEPEVEDGYARGFFEHWIDADGDNCDTRHEVLIAESLTSVTVGDGCSIEDGSWYSAADGDTLTNPASIDINHVVPLKEAWASGAYTWTPEQRQAFANDLGDDRTLQAVSAGANRQQGDDGPGVMAAGGPRGCLSVRR